MRAASKILLVEDDDQLPALMSEYLLQHGLEVDIDELFFDSSRIDRFGLQPAVPEQFSTERVLSALQGIASQAGFVVESSWVSSRFGSPRRDESSR